MVHAEYFGGPRRAYIQILMVVRPKPIRLPSLINHANNAKLYNTNKSNQDQQAKQTTLDIFSFFHLEGRGA